MIFSWNPVPWGSCGLDLIIDQCLWGRAAIERSAGTLACLPARPDKRGFEQRHIQVLTPGRWPWGTWRGVPFSGVEGSTEKAPLFDYILLTVLLSHCFISGSQSISTRATYYLKIVEKLLLLENKLKGNHWPPCFPLDLQRAWGIQLFWHAFVWVCVNVCESMCVWLCESMCGFEQSVCACL